MQTLRQIKGRIRSIANTRKITSAMQMVSAAKLSRSRAAFHSYRVYMDRLESLLKNFSAGMKAASHPFLDEREDKSSATLCVIASDSGLCGTYNNNILSTAKKFLDSNKDRKIDVIAVGHEVSKFMKKRNIRVTDEYPNLYGKYNPKACDELTRLFIDKFTSGGSAEIYISYTKFSCHSDTSP